MRRLATWCFRHRRAVIVAWLLALVVATAASRAVGLAYSNAFALPDTPSSRAIQLLRSALPAEAGDVEQVVVATTAPGLTLTDPAVEARVQSMLQAVAARPHVARVVSPYSPAGAGQLSANRTTGFATVFFDRPAQGIPDAQAKGLIATAKAAAGSGLEVAVGGQVAEKANRPSVGGTGFGILAAAVVLLVVFGSVLAAFMPLLSALIALGTAIGVIGLLTHVMRMPDFSSQLVVLIGLGVGVDYALFIVTRHRQGLLAGLSVEQAAITAVNTSGRAVLFAGIVVCIALLGMFALGISFLYGVAVASSIGVLLTMLAALTLLPALLGFMGERILSRRQRRHLAKLPLAARPEGFWASWARLVDRVPAVPAALALAAVVVIALPFFSMRLGSTDQGSDPPSTTTRQAYDLLARGFGPGFNGPLEVVARGPATASDAVGRLVDAIGAEPGVARTSPPLIVPARGGGLVAVDQVFPTTAPQAEATTDLLRRIRTVTVPSAIRGSGLTVYVGGTTAVFVDFAAVLGSKLALFVGVIVLLSFVLLAVVFRSVVIPLTAAAMNLLSAGAAYGLVTAVFQWGWAGSVIGVNRTGPVEAFLPVMLFSILFGLSMDYQVFLVTRIHEEWLLSGDNRAAVRVGLAATGRTITAAAAIMILVFASFVLGGSVIIKEFGVGLAGAILVDAVIVRMCIVPALMHLFGRANWWFPSPLERVLPHFSVDAVEAGEAPLPMPDPEYPPPVPATPGPPS
ncbi:MAG TPA: MMPL family transporter [Acidimicrobiales bacterium]|nr:MMPL family transporter [Acidimicrobiales bacterium]